MICNVVATIKPWNISEFENIKKFPGIWVLIRTTEELEQVFNIKPRYIFFPHWSSHIPAHIYEKFECIGFHTGHLPEERGGSPIQNLITKGVSHTQINAIRIRKETDSGEIYLSRVISLEGGGEEVFIRIAKKISEMIKDIVEKKPTPIRQSGIPGYFHRRTAEESEIKEKSLDKLFDHIRMLDVETYPKAFFKHEGLTYEFSRPSKKVGYILCDAKIYEDKK